MQSIRKKAIQKHVNQYSSRAVQNSPSSIQFSPFSFVTLIGSSLPSGPLHATQTSTPYPFLSIPFPISIASLLFSILPSYRVSPTSPLLSLSNPSARLSSVTLPSVRHHGTCSALLPRVTAPLPRTRGSRCARTAPGSPR